MIYICLILLLLFYVLLAYRIFSSFFYDFKLGIKTKGYMRAIKKGFNRTESTPYSSIKSIVKTLDINKNDRIVDFGCGKGRVAIAFNYFANVNTIGIEANESALKKFEKNISRYEMKTKKSGVSTYLGLAQDYEIKEEDNVFFFFNPFDVDTFRMVIENIQESCSKYDRQATVVLYTPLRSFLNHMDYVGFEEKKKITHWGKCFPSESIYIFKI